MPLKSTAIAPTVYIDQVPRHPSPSSVTKVAMKTRASARSLSYGLDVLHMNQWLLNVAAFDGCKMLGDASLRAGRRPVAAGCRPS